MKPNIETMLDAVIDEQSLLLFIAALSADWEDERQRALVSPNRAFSAGANGWENGTVGAYLDAAASWGQASINGLPKLANYKKPENPWQRVAQILYMGKIYE